MGSPGIAAPLSDGSMLLKLGDKIMVLTTGVSWVHWENRGNIW